MNFNSPLKSSSPQQWADHILDHFDTFLLDHAACERKAAALAMSFVAKYPDRVALIDPMVALAREELEHFQEVFHLIQKRNLSLGTRDEKDPYINTLLEGLRHGRNERFLDRLVMSGLVEARGYERFKLLSTCLKDTHLRAFYARLADREAGHYRIFLRIAKQYFSEVEVDEALERISELEAKSMREAPLRSALH